MRSFHYDIYFKMMLEAYLFNLLAAATEVVRINDASDHTVSYSISATMLVLFLLFNIFLLICYLKFKPSSNKYLKVLYKEMRSNNLAKLYNFFFTLRRIIIVSIIVVLKDVDSNIRLGVFLIFQFLALVYSFTVKPFGSWKGKINFLLVII